MSVKLKYIGLRCREQRYGRQGGKLAAGSGGGRGGGGGGGGMNWEIGIDIYPLICIKWLTNKKKIK